MNKIFIVKTQSSSSDHRESYSSSSVLATTTDEFTAYAKAIEVWLSEYFYEYQDSESNPNDLMYFESICLLTEEGTLESLKSLHQIFTDLASDHWRNEYGGDIRFSIEIIEQELTEIQTTVDCTTLIPFKQVARAYDFLQLPDKDVGDYQRLYPQLFEGSLDLSLECRSINNTTWERLSLLKGLQALTVSGRQADLKDGDLDGIGTLASLESLIFDIRGLSLLPDSIGKLLCLKRLKVYGAELSSLTTSIGDLEQLEELAIRSSNLSVLPESFGNLTNLEICRLDDCPLEGLPQSFGNLSSLQELHIEYKYGDLERVALSLPKTMGGLTSLRSLYISGQIEEIPDSFGELTALRSVHLDHSKLTNLPITIHNLSLETVKLDNRETLSDEGIESICSISTLQSIEIFRAGLTHIPNEILHCSQLSRLNFFDNDITDVPQGLSGLTNLTQLILSNNAIGELDHKLTTLPNLSELWIQDNPLGKEERRWWNDTLRSLSTLRRYGV